MTMHSTTKHPSRPALLALATAVVAICAAMAIADPFQVPAEQQLEGKLRSFVSKHCQECHGGQKPEGGFSVEQLSADLFSAPARQRWTQIHDRLAAGEMPPKDKPRPPAADIAAVTEWISQAVARADAAARQQQGRTVLRRLNRVEYENTIRDLLGIHFELQDLLPPDSSAAGFDNVGEALHSSSFLLEKYLEAADKALQLAISNRPQPPLVKKRYSLADERLVKTTTESVYLQRPDSVVMFSSSPWNAITVGQFYPPDRGVYRVRISAHGFQSGHKPVTFRVDAGPMLMGTKNHLVGYFEVPPDRSTVIEFQDHFEARNHFRIHPYGLANAQAVNKVGAEAYEGPGLAVEWIEVEGPLHDQWPPKSHRQIFGDLPQAPSPAYNQRDRVEVISSDALSDAKVILKRFASRAFRRPASDEDLKPYLALVEHKLEEGYSFEAAVRTGLKGVLMSPRFLFFDERPGPLDNYGLASRLSYFLWSTMPDDELLALAESGRLREPAVLREQVERMLSDPRSQAFVVNFTGQWLGLRDIDFTEPSHILYPEFDAMLKESMVREAQLFFAEILDNDLSLANFVASDFTMLNGRLAAHYGIGGVEGWEFKRTPLPPESHRGGVLTMAGVLKVTANGTTTSPVMRGVWVLDRILGRRPSPPPADVPAIEPDIRGATTIREQLAKHRSIEECAVCHRHIDPPGFALENFDVIGGWREHYRTTGAGESVTIDGRRMPYHRGKPVDPADTLADGRAFKNVDELKALLLENKDEIARSLATRLVTYATGAPPTAADRPALDAIVAQTRERDYGLRTLVHEVVQSELFRSK
jgi:mono/diheme cytochrome c family protein